MSQGHARAHAGCVKEFEIKIKTPISKIVFSKEKHSSTMISNPLHLWKASESWPTLSITVIHSAPFSPAASTLPTADTDNGEHSFQQPMAARVQGCDLRRTHPLLHEKGLLP